MDEFKFNINMTVEENVESFFTLIKLVDEEMANLLMRNINKMTPLTDQARQRTTARIAFNKAIMEGLENLSKSKRPEE
jgi:hypothetical protein